jgi:hypothetical protein
MLVVSLTLTLASCTDTHSMKIESAEAVISAFYSWDCKALAELLEPDADPSGMLYYQGWAEAANYIIRERRECVVISDREVECAVTVSDDFGTALGYIATDTFRFTFDGDRIVNVTFEGDDPPIFQELFAWISEYRPEVLSGPCRDMFAGGTTPGACARAVADSARSFISQRTHQP